MTEKEDINIFILGRKIYNKLSLKSRRELKLVQISLILNSISEILSLSLIIPFLSIISSSESSINLGFLKYLIPKFISQNQTNSTILVTSLFIFFAILSGLIRLGNTVLINKIAAKIGSEISCNAYLSFLKKDYEDFIQINTSEKINSLTDLTQKTLVVISAYLQLVSCLIVSICIYSTLLFYNWETAVLIGIIFFTIYVILGKYLKKLFVKNSKNYIKKSKKLVQAIREGFGSIRDIQMNNSQYLFTDIYKKIDFPMRNILSQNKYLSVFPKYIIEAFGLAFMAAIGCIISLNYQNPSKVIGFLGLFALGVQKLLPYLQQTFGCWSNIQSYGNSALEVTKEIDFNLINKNKNSFPVSTKNLKFSSLRMENISYRYPNSKKYIINNFNFEIKKGDFIGVKGRSGYGKSTLVDIIMCLIRPTKGRVLINGSDIYGKDLLDEWKSLISHVPQNIFIADKSIKENIAFNIKEEEINLNKILISSKISLLDEFIQDNEKGFNSNTGENGVKLSGGQRQRIAIARAIYKDSEFLILDESTSALDNNNEKKILKNILSMKKKKTIILISHNLSTLKQCDQILEIQKDGTIKIVN